jgi:hypothetical protein
MRMHEQVQDQERERGNEGEHFKSMYESKSSTEVHQSMTNY